MFGNFFRRKEQAASTPGLPILQRFIDYLATRDITPKDIYIFKKIPKPSKWGAFEKLIAGKKYFILPNPGAQRKALTDYFAAKGVTVLEGDDLILGGADVNYQKTASARPLRIAAIVHVFNECDVLGETIRHLLDQGLHVHIIDNWSTDGSWELAGSFGDSGVTRERFPEEGASDDYEWFRQLEHTETLALRLPYDWFLHYDADELRYSPWPGIRLSDAITFIDHLGYNAIDFTIMDFRYTPDNDQVKKDFEEKITWFEFGKRPGHFLQVKGWKKQGERIELKSSGGHTALFTGRKLYPVKFLTKHYSLRSKEQAENKLVNNRLPRIQKELQEKNWHSHIKGLITQQHTGWNKETLIEYTPAFHQRYLIERISGEGV